MRPIGQFTVAGRTRFVIDIGGDQVVTVDPGRDVSVPFDRDRWYRVNGDRIDPLADFVGAAAAHAEARAAREAVTAPPHTEDIDPDPIDGPYEVMRFDEVLRWLAGLEDGWDDRFDYSLAPGPVAVEAARQFMGDHTLPEPEVEPVFDGTITLHFYGPGGEVGFTFDRDGAFTAVVRHQDSVVISDDLPERWLTELGVGLIRFWNDPTGVPNQVRHLVLVDLVDDGSGVSYVVDLDDRSVERTDPDSGTGVDTVDVLAAHIDDIASIAREQHSPPGLLPPPLRTEDGVLETRLADLGVELIEAQLVRFPSGTERHPEASPRPCAPADTTVASTSPAT